MVIRNTALNLAGLGVPLVLAVFTIPPLIRALGPERFGILTLIWAVVSYFGLFDLGLGRALTQRLSTILAGRDTSDAKPLVRTALVLMGALGTVAGAVLFVGAPFVVSQMRSVPDAGEVVRAVHYLAFALPFIVGTSGLRGVLESVGAFRVLNLIRLPMGLVTFAGPLMVVHLAGPRLDLVAALLSAARVVAWFAHAVYVVKEGRSWPGTYRFSPIMIRPLSISGGWLTISNIVSPFMGYMDRFLIGAMISVAAVAYYATPNEMVTKLWIVPAALTAVLLPRFSALSVTNRAEVRRLFRLSVLAMFVGLLPVTGILVVYAEEVLSLWIDKDFARESGTVLRVMAVGIFLNCVAHIPATYLHAIGAFRLVAIIHCVELPFFALLLYASITRFGVQGAAWAWTLRLSVDAVVVFYFASRHSAGVQQHT